MKKEKNQVTHIFWAAVILWMVLIFSLSSQVGEQSNQLSLTITEIVMKIVERIVPQADLNINYVNHVVRKSFHFFVYAVLGFLVLNALRKSGVYGYRSILLSLLICVLYAIGDELHQLFVPGRGGQIKDVIIDSIGAAFGIGMYLLIRCIGKGRKSI